MFQNLKKITCYNCFKFGNDLIPINMNKLKVKLMMNKIIIIFRMKMTKIIRGKKQKENENFEGETQLAT